MHLTRPAVLQPAASRSLSAVYPYFQRSLAFVLGWLFIPVALFAVQLEANVVYSWVAALVGVALVVFLNIPGSPFFRLPTRYFLLIAVLVFVASRVIWISRVPTLPFSDFEGYDVLARLLAAGEPIQEPLGYGYLLSPWGYPLVLAAWYTLAGEGLLGAKLFNVLLGVISLLLLYRLSAGFSPRIARVVTLLFVLWPAQWMYSSVLASEHFALVPFLAALVFLQKALRDLPASRRELAFAGILLAVCVAVRPALAVALAAGLLVIAIRSLPAPRLMAAGIGQLLLAFALAYLAYLGFMRLVYNVTPAAQGSFALLTGTNFETGGSWNLEDANRYLSYPTFAEANQFAREEALRRITSDPRGFIKLVLRKVPKTWGDDSFGFYWSTVKLERSSGLGFLKLPYLSLFSQYFHIFLLVLGILGWFSIARGRYLDHDFGLLVAVILGVVALHSLLETQSRYHFTTNPILMIFASFGILAAAGAGHAENHPPHEHGSGAGERTEP